MSKEGRPLGFTLLAIFDFIIGAFCILGGVLAIGLISFIFPILNIFSWILGSVLIFAGIIIILFGYAIWIGWTPYWYLSVFLIILGIISQLWSFTKGAGTSLLTVQTDLYSILSLCWSLVVLWYYWTRRWWFKIVHNEV